MPDGTPITYHRIPDIRKREMPTIAEQVAKRMRELEWTKANGTPNISTLADKAGLGYATANEIINGKSEPAVPTLRALAKALRVSVDWLLGDEGELDVRSFEQGRDFVDRVVRRALEDALKAEITQRASDEADTTFPPGAPEERTGTE